MCGIVSIISKRQGGFWHADLELFESLLILDTLRGLDSTGVFCVDSARQVGYMKVASHPFHLFQTQEYPGWRGRAVQQGRILVGHNRKATQGSINSKNAHPFHAGNIVLVHNGTLRGDHKKDFAPVDVDSHSLAIAFDEHGAENVIPKINGAFALIWWDIAKSRLFAVRNDERPLQIVETDDHIIILSEAWMALQLLAKQGKKVTNVIDIDPGKLHEIEIGGRIKVTDIEVQKDYWTNNAKTYSQYKQHGGAQASSVTDPKSQPSSEQKTAAGPTNQSVTTASPTTTSRSADPRPTTALTLVKQDSQQGSGVDPAASTSTNLPLPVDMANHVPCEEFTRGQTVLVKLYEMKPSGKDGLLYFCRGKVSEPNCPEIDVVAYIKTADVEGKDPAKFMHRAVEAVVVKHTTSVCGRSLYVNKVSVPKYVRVHNNDIAENEWNYVTTYCKCQVCKATIFDEEREYTSVWRRPDNQFAVTCAECIEDTLKGEAKNEFNQNRLIAVQAYIGKRESAASSTDSGTQAPGTTTLQ